ncbi:hypothetical protein L9F63_003783, partial [Diploptera punctata]
MDISFSNVLEGARQYFQGLPSPASSSSSQQTPQGGSSVNEPPSTNNSPRYNNPDSAQVGSTPPHYENVAQRPTSQQPATAPPPSHTTVASSASSTVLSYWPPQPTANSVYQRTKDVSAPGPTPAQVQHHYVPSKMSSGSSTAHNVSHTVYNGSRLNVSDARTMNYPHQNHLQPQQASQQQQLQQQQQPSRPQGHNLPPIAALPNYHSSRNSRDSTHRLNQHQQHMPAASLQTHQISSKITIPNSTSLLRTQSEYNTQMLQNQQYTSGNSGSVNTGTIQYGMHRNQKYQQPVGSTPPASYSNYTSPQPQQTAATSISSSSSASASSSVYQSSLHHSQQQQAQQQYTYHLPHHTQSEVHMKPEHSSKRQYSSHQNYYNPSTTGRPQPPTRSLPPSSSTSSAIRSGRNKRESPLDLSVKTVRQSADSTAKDDMESSYSYSPVSVEHQPRGKTGVAAIRSQQTGVLPPLQLPSSVAYPTFDSRGRPTSSNTPASAPTPSVGAPKVDYLPNFASVSQHGTTVTNSCVTDSQRPSGRTNPVHHQLYSQTSGTTLPHVGSFRKSSSTTVNSIPGSYEQKQAPFYAATPISQTQHRHSNTNSSSASTMLPPYSTSSSNHYPSGYEKRMPDPMANYGTNRLDFQNRSSSQNNVAYMTSSATIGQKRGSSETRHPSPAKVPRLDKWKQTIDQQIEQRFSSYTSSRAQQQQQHQQQQIQSNQQQVNGNVENSRHDAQYSHHHIMHHQSQHHPRATAPAAVTATSQPQHGYPQTMPYVPSHGHGHQQYQTAHRLLTNPATLQSQQALNRTITAATAGGVADKRVISILRNSLEIKEARMTELQNQLQNRLQQQQQNILAHRKASPVQQLTGRHNLPQFPIGVDPNAQLATQIQSHKIHVPKAVESVSFEAEVQSIAPRVPSAQNVVRTEMSESIHTSMSVNSSNSNSGDPDGFAAILAARIRTKAELKQVGPIQYIHQPLQLCSHHHHHTKCRLLLTSSAQSGSGASSSGGSPPKLTRERVPFPPRRRLFSRPDEEPGGTNNSVVIASGSGSLIPPRDSSGLRSSSETSVFDFRDSDSEGEMPVLEMQTLDEMRRDRKSHTKNQIQTSSNEVSQVIELAGDVAADTTSVSEDVTPLEVQPVSPFDPSFSDACDKFVEQLKTGSLKRKVRRKKTVAELKAIPDKIYDRSENIEIKVENIDNENKVEHVDQVKVENKEDEKMNEMQTENSEVKQPVKIEEKNLERKELKKKVEKCITKENYKYDSDEDVPLIRRRGRPRKKDIDVDVEDEISLAEIKARLGKAEKSRPAELLKMARSRSSSSSSNTSSELSSDEEDGDDDDSDSHEETVAERLRRRKRQGKDDPNSIGMRLRSKTPSTPQKASPNEKEKSQSPGKSSSKKKKALFGDGSDFRPGWEEEVYRFKRSLRMPDRLINIPRPPHTHRLSASLPDLDPYPNSPAASTVDSSDFSPQRRNLSRPASFNHGRKAEDLIVDSEEATSSTTLSTKLKNNDNNNSILNLLVRKYSKSSRKKSLEKKFAGHSGFRTIPRSSDGPELLPTPSLGIGLKKSPSGKAGNKKDSVYLGYFRKKTVTNFRDAFLQNGGVLAQNFAPIVYKSRTRTQTRVLRKHATIREVFGADRPASAPPICQEEREIELTEKKEVKAKLRNEEISAVCKTRSNSTSGGRPGLRSAGLRRSNKALLNSKRRLLRRDHDLMRNRSPKKMCISQDDGKDSRSSPPSSTSQQIEGGMVPPNGKRIKLRSVRRKFRSGFDYIRKKKKQQKKEGESEGPKDKKKVNFLPSSESVQDIQAEIRGWVINKGLGETLLHRAARLGYTDVAAYCLEKLDNPPSPRDNAGYTPLHEACSRGHLDIARLLLMYGANVSDSALGGIRPLHEAAENGFTELIRLLLSYGADPLLATYSGCTPLSLATDDEARRLLQYHLADVQGLPAPPWNFQGPASCCDPPENGYDPLLDPPTPSPEPLEDVEVEIESSELALPVLYRLRCEPPGERWVLLQDLTQVLRIKSRDALLRQLCAEAKSVMRELKMADFLEQARSCHLACASEKINVRASKVALVRYNEKVKQLLGVEKVTIGVSVHTFCFVDVLHNGKAVLFDVMYGTMKNIILCCKSHHEDVDSKQINIEQQNKETVIVCQCTRKVYPLISGTNYSEVVQCIKFIIFSNVGHSDFTDISNCITILAIDVMSIGRNSYCSLGWWTDEPLDQ